jgi:membrane protease YdiL (CAAX protease family)
MEIFIALAYIGITIYMANRQDARGEPEALARGLLVALIVGMALMGFSTLPLAFDSALPTQTAADASGDILPQMNVQPGMALAFLLLSLLGAVLSYAILRSEALRVFIQQRVIGARKAKQPERDQQGLEPHTQNQMIKDQVPVWRFNPDSMVHTTALILAIFGVLVLLWTFVLSGGLEGISQEVTLDSAEGVSVGQINSLIYNAVIFVLLSLLGVGLYIRRDLGQALRRLGLYRPRWADVRLGLLVGLGLFMMQVVAGIVWLLLSSPEVFEQQTQASQAIFESFSGSLFAGFLLALTAAIGEETLFRGALQPVFGIWLSSILFAILHTQYTLTPAALIILLVSLTLGWLRQRHNTNAAIVAHFVYNMIPFLLVL